MTSPFALPACTSRRQRAETCSECHGASSLSFPAEPRQRVGKAVQPSGGACRRCRVETQVSVSHRSEPARAEGSRAANHRASSNLLWVWVRERYQCWVPRQARWLHPQQQHSVTLVAACLPRTCAVGIPRWLPTRSAQSRLPTTAVGGPRVTTRGRRFRRRRARRLWWTVPSTRFM